MPAPPPAFYAVNVLENAAWTMDPDGAVPGKGPDRLADRDIGLECEDAGTTGVRAWTADRGLEAPAPVVSVWLIAGNGYAGQAVTLWTSDDAVAWAIRATVTPTADTPQRVPLDPTFPAPRFVRVTVTDPPGPVRFTEISLGPTLSFKWKPAAGTMREPQHLNVNTVTSVSGRGWGVQRGPRRWSSAFVMTAAPDADRVRMLALLDDLADTAKPFWYFTVTQELRWVRLQGPIDAAGVSKSPSGEWDLPVSVIEELP